MAILLALILTLLVEHQALKQVAAWRRRRELLESLIAYASAKLGSGYNRAAVGPAEILELVREELGLRVLQVEGRGGGALALIPIQDGAEGADGAMRREAAQRDELRVYYALDRKMSRRQSGDVRRTLGRIFSGGVAE